MRRAILVLVAVAAVCGVVKAQTPLPAGVTPDDLRAAFYDYDPALALNARVGPAPKLKDESAKQIALRKRQSVAFDSAHDQRVSAVLTLPRRFAAPHPAIVLLAGSGGHKDTDYVRIASDMLSTLGYATLSIDAQYHGDRARPGRSGDFHFINSPTSRDAWVQTVIDLRRSIDYLSRRSDIRRDLIGYVGFSQGGMVGGTLAGIDGRLAAVCLVVPGGGFMEWAGTMGISSLKGAARLEVNAAITDPVYWIGRHAPRPLLILAARRDELIPASASEALYAAAGQPKTITWFNSGHLLPPTAILVDAKSFLQRHLGVRQPRP